jgi:uncharacterized protein YuzE
MKLAYDKATDTLYVFVGDQKDTVARDAGNGILLKYDRKSNKPVGAVIHDFQRRFNVKEEPLEIPVPA